MDRWRQLLDHQAGVVHRLQALAAGRTGDEIRHQVRRGSWRPIHPGVYATFTGQLSFEAKVWAAVLHAGPHAAASHRTAARLQGLADEDPKRIELSVPHGHQVTDRPDLRVHQTRQWESRRHPGSTLPQTRVEDTVLDLVAEARTTDEVVRWVLRACQRRLTTPGRLRVAAARRQRLRHRALVQQLVSESSVGVASALERRYRRDVERAHGLPRGDRGQAWSGPDGRRRYYDCRYHLWRMRVELEGLAFHPDDRSWVDHQRDNAAVLLGDVVLRYGWREVVADPCGVAGQVAAVLRLRGWEGTPTRCGPSCTSRKGFMV